jgi:UDP-N-acetylglucosamine 2-epimerase (non-hydrolysing)
MNTPFRLLLVVGARPNFMKMAPIIHELKKHPGAFEWRLVHTGQHYDAAMSEIFFEQLGIPQPDVDLGVGSGSHAQQTAAVMAAFEPQVLEWRPHLVVVVGDVNSTLACALVATKLQVAVAHVEAGLRSFDRSMPEEINRMLTDQISDLLFTTEASAEENLRREGIDRSKIHFTGNVMIDTLLTHSAEARRRGVCERLGLTARQYGVLTLHRPSNVDDPQAFERLFKAIGRIAEDLPFVFPVHPRTRPALERSASVAPLIAGKRLLLFDPLGYLDFLGLMADSAVVLTDSGGIQEETTVLGIPCLTMRETTERPVTISDGTNLLVGTDPSHILDGWQRVRQGRAAGSKSRVPPLWDGRAAERIVGVLRSYAAQGAAGSDERRVATGT